MSEIAIADDYTGANVAESIKGLNAGTVSVYSSLKGDDFETKKRVLEATTNAEVLADHLGETIELEHIVIQAVDVSDPTTGEVNEAARTILLAKDGTSYAAVSGGIFKAVENLLGILGEPTAWPAPVPIQVVKERGRKGFDFFTIKLV